MLKLSLSLIETYKNINKIYYEARARQRALEESEGGGRGGMYNGGYDDQHYDYIVQPEEVIMGRYLLKHKIGKVGLFVSLAVFFCQCRPLPSLTLTSTPHSNPPPLPRRARLGKWCAPTTKSSRWTWR